MVEFGVPDLDLLEHSKLVLATSSSFLTGLCDLGGLAGSTRAAWLALDLHLWGRDASWPDAIGLASG